MQDHVQDSFFHEKIWSGHFKSQNWGAINSETGAKLLTETELILILL